MTIKNNVYATEIYEQIQYMGQTRIYFENLVAKGYKAYESQLSAAAECEQKLWDQYYSTQLDTINDLNIKIEEELRNLQQYTNKLQGGVKILEEANDILSYVTKLLLIALTI